MGYAVPAAMAAKLALPERPTVAFMGDGGLLGSLVDIAAAARLGLRLVIVVFLDGSLSWLRVAQEQRKYAPVGVTLGAQPLDKLAEGLGAVGAEVASEEELRSALAEAAETSVPAIIGVPVQSGNYRRVVEILRGRAA
jgi:acetolactate synthase-1/2/3 large subunit